MATLIVDFHCMCLFVPDESTGAVHVLMPAMHGPGHNHGHTPPANGNGGGATGGHAHDNPPKAEGEGGTPTAPGNGGGNGTPEKHVVRMLHRSFTGQPLGRPMEGWSLILDDGQGAANRQLKPFSETNAEVPDITTISSKVVSPSLVSSLRPEGVVSRVTLRAGAATECRSNGFEWTLNGVPNRVLAHAVTWVIPNVPDELTWVRLDATQPPPIRSLKELEPEANDLYRIRIHHETERTLPSGTGPGLKADEVADHFAAFYTMLGMPTPSSANPQDQALLPIIEGKGGGSILCRTAQARLTL